ncbi:MAG: hypothetical protein GX596_06665 [Propionibacterium sp.]|nr:hypothetical protein [Propionibacterium sp.]
MMRRCALLGSLVLVALATGMLALAAAPAEARVQAFKKIGHTRTYDVVRGHQRTLIVYRAARYVKWRGQRRYEVLQRRRNAVILRKLRTPLRSSTAQIVNLPGAPLSVGKPASASSVVTSATADAANDGRPETRWAASESRVYPQWWLVDLGAETKVYGVKIAWQASTRAYRYRVATSVDGLDFKVAADRSKNRTRGATTDAFSAVARYVRVVVLGVSPAGVPASAYEITVNGEPAETPEPTPEPTPSPSASPNTPDPTPGQTPTETPTPTPTVTPTASASPTPEPSETPTPEPTPTVEPTSEPTPTVEPTSEPTPTETPTPTPTVTPTASASPTPAEGFNVMDYGARGDGRTDDTARIQSAIAAAHGATVYFPEGTYRLASTLTVPDGARLVGAGMTSTWLQGQVVFGSNSSFTGLKIGPASAGVSGLKNTDGATGTSFTRCHFRGGGAASDARNSSTVNLGDGRDLSNLTFTDCEFERSLGTAWSGAADTTHRDNTVSIYANSCTVDTVTFDSCHLGVSNGVATGAQRMMVEVWTAHGAGNWWKNITFTGCTFEPSNIHQIDFACYDDSGQGDGVLVEGCTFKGGGLDMKGTLWGYAICLEWPKNVVIRNNHFYRCHEAAIYSANFGQSYDTKWHITGNTFDWDTAYAGITARRGIVVITGASNTVTGNTFNWHGSFSGWANNGCVEFAGAKATRNTVTGNTFSVSQTQRIGNDWGGATGNGSPWTATNTVNRQ